MLRTYRTYNSTVGFSKYEFYNKLLDGVTLLKVTPSVTWTQPIYIYIYITGSSHIWCNYLCYITQYFLIGSEF